MSSLLQQVEYMYSSDDDSEEPESNNIDVPVCSGLPRRQWVTNVVTLYNNDGVMVGEGTCHSVKSDLVLGAHGPLGDTHIAVHISRSHSEEDVPSEWIYQLIAWPITHAHYRGASLHDHEARDKFNCLQARMNTPESVRTSRPYTSVARNERQETTRKSMRLLSQDSINEVSSKVCCSMNCVQPFDRARVRNIRERMYRKTTFQFRCHMKMDVHRQVHRDDSGRKVVTLEGIDVCLRAWMHITGVPESTFYRYQKYVIQGNQAQPHGNVGSVKTRYHTVQAMATMKTILESTADHMPHRTKTLVTGEKVVSKILPPTFQWKGVLPRVNEANAAFGLKNVSLSNLSKIRSTRFQDYDIKKPGDSFARCGTCDHFQSLKKGTIAFSEQYLKWDHKLEKHMAVARAHRELYYANRDRSRCFPEEMLTITHDKMDHSKTACPVFSHKSKDLDGLMKLPVSVTGMIAHGHGDVRYAHYGLDLFAHDSNYTVGSLAKLLRDLELPPKFSSRELFRNSKSSPLFEAVLRGSEICEASLLPPPTTPVEAKCLPPILHVQMDNAVGDNKNRYVYSFWSLLVAKKIFREVFVNFMLVGHTHDDIDAMFGRWSMLLKKDNFLTVPQLMKSFMDVDSVPTIPHLVEEVPNFKDFIEGHYIDGEDVLIGHTRPQQVKFFVDASGCPRMKYKLKCTDKEFLPKESSGIKLWKEDAEGRSLWPRGDPKPLPLQNMRGIEDIVKGISGFIRYWDNMCNADLTGEFRRRFEYLVYYWRGIWEQLLITPSPSVVLKDGFWPSTRVAPVVEDQFEEDGEDREEFGEDEAYVGPLSGRPLPSFRVGRDLYEGYFVAVRPADGDPRPVWIARAMSNPDTNPERPNCVLIQYYKPTSRVQDVQEHYTGWDSARGLRWKVNEEEPPLWEETNALMTAWKSRGRHDSMECMIKIPSTQVAIIRQSLVSYD